MKRLGNTPTKQTNFFLDRGKSFAFAVMFEDKHEQPLDMTGGEVRIVVEEPQHFGGAEVIQVRAEEVDASVGHFEFELQASELLLEPAEYPYDITFLSASNYSTPVVKGFFVIGDNTDDDVSNTYPGIDSSQGVKVVWDNGATIKLCLDFAEGIKGDQGDPGEIVVVETITGQPGTEAYVQDLDSSPGRAALKFTIPRGDPGGTTGAGGTTVHGDLLGLPADDHLHYHTDARGDARYLQLIGGVLTGPLELAEDADDPMEPVTLRQLETAAPDEVWVGPDTPPNGQEIWIDTDEPDPGGGAGGVVEAGYYRHDQATLAVTWVVNHSLGYRPAVHVQDAVGNVLVGSIQHLSDAALIITFKNAQTGSAHCS